MQRRKATFDPRIFLAKVGRGKTVSKYQKDQIVFSQGEAADAVFYIQQGSVKLTVVSEQGKEAVVAIFAVIDRPRCCDAQRMAIQTSFPKKMTWEPLAKLLGDFE
jgi:CRP-like cAMP-binding protein